MEIGIKHYLRNETTKKQSQHILDSFSESSAEELQNTVEDEITHTSGSTDTESTVGGTIMVIDRFSGEFGISYLIVPEDKKISGMTAKGLCNKKQF